MSNIQWTFKFVVESNSKKSGGGESLGNYHICHLAFLVQELYILCGEKCNGKCYLARKNEKYNV